MQINTKLRIAEFIVAGLLVDTVENIISIKLSTGAAITKEIFITAFLVVIPFAVLTELVIDHPKFWERFLTLSRKLIGKK